MVLLPEQGQLSQTSFPSLLLDLHRAAFHGVLRLSHSHIEKSIFLRDGIPVYADSNLGSESLGRRLVDSGTISPDQHTRLVEHSRLSGCKEGKSLLELELLAPREVFDAIKDQVRFRVLDCFGWSQGGFRIEPGDAASEEAAVLRADLYRLLQEGIESHWARDRVLQDLESRLQQFAARSGSLDKLRARLHSDEALEATLAAMDGSRSLWQCLQLAATPRALAAVWVFDAVEVIDYAETPRSEEAAELAPAEIEIVCTDGGASEATPAREVSRGATRGRSESPYSARLVREISAKHANLSGSDHYALLGVDARADAAALKSAYFAAAKDYHPDALARLGIDGEARDQAGQVFSAVGRAYAVLTNPTLRREYDAQLAGTDLGADAEQIATAETLYRKGEILVRQGNFRGALEFLRPAVEIYPDEADYQHALGWSLYKKAPSEPEAARGHLERAAELAPNDPVLLFRLSVVMRRLGEPGRADELLEKAKSLDPAVN